MTITVREEVGELGNQIHNLGCEYQNDEKLSTRLEELRTEAWRIASSLKVPAAMNPLETAPQDRRFLAKVWNMQYRRPTPKEVDGMSAFQRSLQHNETKYRRSGTQWVELWFNPSAGEFKEWAGSPRVNVSGSPEILAWVELPDGDNEIKAQY